MPGRLFTLFAAALCSFLMNCGGEKKADSTQQTDTVQAAGDTIAYTLTSLELKSQNCRREDSACAVARYSYPELAAAAPQALKDSVNAVWAGLFGPCAQGTGPRGCAEAFIKGYEETVAGARKAGMDYSIAWYSNVSATVFQERGLFGIQSVSEEFGGGAHPNTEVSTFHLHPATGRRLTYSDLFTDMAALNKRLEEGFYSKYRLKPGKPLSQDQRFFPDATLKLPDVWMPESDSLYLYWNTYELGPHAAGDFDLKVDVRDLYKGPPAA